MSQVQQAQFRIINILFAETHFKRELIIDFGIEIINQINIDKKIQNEEENGKKAIVVSVSTEIKGIQNGSLVVYECTIETIGVFEKIGESELNEETFGNINAPAILFPFIREHFASLALKAGVGSVYLPPINFTKRAE